VVRTVELLDRPVVRVLDEITDPKGEIRWGLVGWGQVLIINFSFS